MKKIFKKAITVLGSVALVGATVGVAVAASYPSPFTSNTVVITGANAQPSDGIAAVDVDADLTASATTTDEEPTEGDSVLIEKSTDKLNLGNSASTVWPTSIDKDDLPSLLASGTYNDNDNTDFDFTQKITLGSNLNVMHFSDSSYEDSEPTVGIHLSGNQHVVNYTLDFTELPNFNDTFLETTDLTLLGKTYYVSDVQNSTTEADRSITLLDSASSAVVKQDETVTIEGKSVAITHIDSSSVKLVVDGETTNSLAAGGTYKLKDGKYVAVKEILYDAKDTGISKAEISIGSGKLVIQHGSAVQLNGDSVDEIVGFITLDSVLKLDTIVLQWTTDDEAFIAPKGGISMPGFGSIKLTAGALMTEAEEQTVVEYDGGDTIELKTTLKSGDVNIPLFKTNTSGDFQTIGEDTDKRLKTSETGFLFFNQTAGDKYIVASYNTTQEGESYYLELDVTTESSTAYLQFKDVGADASTWSKVGNGSDISYGNVVIYVNNLTDDGEAEWANISVMAADVGGSGGSFHELYTAEGLKVYLPFYATSLATISEGGINVSSNGTEIQVEDLNHTFGIYPNTNGAADNDGRNVVLETAGYGFDSIYMFFDEEDKDENLAGGTVFNITLNENSDNKVTVSSLDLGDSSGTYGFEKGNTRIYQGYVNSDLATMSLYDEGGTQDKVTITYHGEQAYVKLRVSASDVQTGGESGIMTITDSELSSAAAKNWVVVGGSAINSAAAQLLGGAYSEGEFTTKTGVSAGKFLIQSFDRGNGKTALLVAGYNTDDTKKGVTYLLNNAVNTTPGKKYLGTSATEAELVVA